MGLDVLDEFDRANEQNLARYVRPSRYPAYERSVFWRRKLGRKVI